MSSFLCLFLKRLEIILISWYNYYSFKRKVKIMLFYFMRHADPIYHPDSLTPLGHRQAEALAKRLCVYGFDKIYSSTSTRALMTAQPTCEILKKDLVQLDWCNEHHAWLQLTALNEDGRRKWLFAHEPTIKLFNSSEIRQLGKNWYEHKAFEGTTYKEGILRIQNESDALFESLGYKHVPEKGGYLKIAPTEERVALFAHAGFGAAFLSCLLDIPYPLFSTRFDISHSSMTVIEFENSYDVVIPRVLTFSNDSHLYKEGLPTKYNNRIYI